MTNPFPRRRFLQQAGGLITTAAFGAKKTMAEAAHNVVIEHIAYKGWQEAFRLSNGTVEVVVVPSVARVMRYAYVGGPNLLWENPTVAGKPIPLNTFPDGGGTGGDKIWPWSQADWPAIMGRDWPAPPAADQAPHQAEIIAPDTLRLVSAPVVPWGLRIVRDIRLSATGTEVHFDNRFVKYRDGAAFPVGVWTITQVPVGGPAVWVRLSPDSTLPDGYRPLNDKATLFPSLTKVGKEGRFLRVERPPTRSPKIGIDGDLLAARLEDTLFTLRIPTPAPADNIGATYAPGERAQVYAQQDDAGNQSKGIAPYFELELTSPRRVLANHETLTLPVVWSLTRLFPEHHSEEAVVEFLSSFNNS